MTNGAGHWGWGGGALFALRRGRVRHIYIVTNGQVPAWLDLNNPRVTVAQGHTAL